MYIESKDGTCIWYNVKKGHGSYKDLYLVFVHGWTASSNNWNKTVDFFNKKGFSIVVLDIRGHGRSEIPLQKKGFRLDEFSKDINNIIKKEKIKKFVLFGHSMGGMITLNYHRLFGKTRSLKGLVLVGSAYKNISHNKILRFILPLIKLKSKLIMSSKYLVKRHARRKRKIDLNKHKNSNDYVLLYKGIMNTDLRTVFACFDEMHNVNLEDDLMDITLPVLILHGTKDSMLPYKNSVEMNKLIKNSEGYFICDGRHNINLNRTKFVNQHVMNFLTNRIL